MSKRETKVVFRKLGRENNDGQAWQEDNLIEIDPRQTQKEMLDTVIHEKLHIVFPDWDEPKVTKTSKKLSSFLWKLGYRMVLLK